MFLLAVLYKDGPPKQFDLDSVHFLVSFVIMENYKMARLMPMS